MKEKPEGARSDFHFRLMAFSYKFRDIFAPRERILQEVDFKPGDWVLDFGF